MADERTRLRMQLGLTPEPTPAKKDTGYKPLTEEQKQARADQLRTQRESAALAEQLGAKIDPETGLIDRTTVTTPFNIYGPKGGKTILKQGYRGSGKDRVFVITYADGSEDVTPAPVGSNSDGNGGGGGKKVVSTYTDPETGDVYLVYSDGSRTLQAKGTKSADAARAKAEADAEAKAGRQSAFDLLYQQFAAYGLQGLVEPLRGLITSGVSPSEFTIKLRETDAYKKRFAANQSRIAKGLRALSEAEYIGLEDQYQDVMRRYGLPDTYYTRGDMGRQEGFERFIGGDVSPVELEDRIQTAQRRVINAAPEVTASLRSFYPEIGQGDLLAYFLDPDKAIENIKRKVTAAEIGGAATMAGLTTGATRAEELGRFGVTGEQARQGFQTIADILPRGSQLAEIYKQSPYTQTTAEQEVFGLTGATEASKRRRQLTQLETAAFSGQAGAAGGALGRERAGAF